MTPEQFARERHGTQARAGTSRRYIVHPEGVARILADHYPDRPDLAAAGWLHDTIEKTETTPDELETDFGPVVRRLVEGVTKYDGVPWEMPTDPDVMRVRVADALDTLTETLEAVRPRESVFERRLTGGRKVPYWRSIADAASGLLGDEPLVRELAAAVTEAESFASAGSQPRPVREMRLVVTADDYDEAVRFYRDVLGLPIREAYESPDGRVTILEAGVATLEIADPNQAEFIDRVEVGRRVAGHIRVAFEVDDSAAMTRTLAAAGAEVLAEPTRTPWDSLNARLTGPAGLQLTLFQELAKD
jgi:lactoylglutathione lyase